jgi:hypothetical protein
VEKTCSVSEAEWLRGSTQACMHCLEKPICTTLAQCFCAELPWSNLSTSSLKKKGSNEAYIAWQSTRPSDRPLGQDFTAPLGNDNPTMSPSVSEPNLRRPSRHIRSCDSARHAASIDKCSVITWLDTTRVVAAVYGKMQSFENKE